jgi:hypothetical protein
MAAATLISLASDDSQLQNPSIVWLACTVNIFRILYYSFLVHISHQSKHSYRSLMMPLRELLVRDKEHFEE